MWEERVVGECGRYRQTGRHPVLVGGNVHESHFFFAILTMLIIPIVGCILGWLADLVMSHIGIDLKHRELAEK